MLPSEDPEDVERDVIGLWPSSLYTVSTQAFVLRSQRFMAPCESPERHVLPLGLITRAPTLASPVRSIATPPELCKRRSST
jgi:hypothetical protein